MKRFSLVVLLCALALIGLLPKEGGRRRQASLSAFVTEAVSADSDYVGNGPGPLAGISPAKLAAGEKLLDEYCSVCHSARLVIKSKSLAGEVDSLVTAMMNKAHGQLTRLQHQQLAGYLESRFPRN